MKGRKFILGLVGVLICSIFLIGGTASASLYTLTDGNSSVAVYSGSEPFEQPAMTGWQVDNDYHLFDQWFYFRVGDTEREYRLGYDWGSVAPSITATQLSGDQLILDYNYANEAGQSFFDIQVFYRLVGGEFGSRQSDIVEQVRVDLGTVSNFHFFQYNDFDLGDADGDTAYKDGSTIYQVDHNYVFSETTIAPPYQHWEIAYYPETLFNLEDDFATTLSDGTNGLGPGDVTWAVQWDLTGDIIISKDKGIRPVPVPPSVLLLGSGLLCWFGMRRKFRS